MDKLKMHSLDGVARNIERIGKLFPNAITEVMRGGRVEHAIDFDVLRQELSGTIVEGREERYQFTWPDKKKAMLAANAPITATLRPVVADSVGRDGTPGGFDSENLYIEGDNLEALKLLQETYLGKIKMIYIDPPYNTGNDFVYEDDFSQSADEYMENSGQFDEEGNRMVTNTESNGRFHTDWLNMIFTRIRLAKSMLTDDGVLFISIDDNEVFNLKKVCDEILGENNFVAQLAVQLNPRGRNLDRYVAKTHESVLIYVRDYLNTASILGVEKEGKMVEEYNKTDARGAYRLIGLRNRNQAFNPTTRPNLYYPLYVDPKTKTVSTIQSDIFTDAVWPDAPDGIKTCWTWMKKKVESENYLLTAELSGGEWRISRKDYLVSEDGSTAITLVKSLWTENTINNDYGKKSIKELFEKNIMSFPKPPELIKRMIAIGSRTDSIVLDFFSGSATTAHAVMQLNAEDGGHRKFIMVQLPEKTDEKSEAYKAGYKNICEIGKERIRRAGEKIVKSCQLSVDSCQLVTENSQLKTDNFDNFQLDIGFRCLRLDESNMQQVYYTPDAVAQRDLFSLVDNVKPDRTPEDLLFQVMLDLGVLLSSSIEVKEIAGKKVFNVADGFLLACFDHDVTDETVKAIAQMKPYYAVFRDSSMANDSVATNFDEIFKSYSPDTVRKVL